MPCAINGDASIPIAQFGRSNVGRMKTVYRHGLGHRYGRVMQAISGVHFNYSFPEHFWQVLADVAEVRATPAQRLPVRQLLRDCCATTGGTAGSCCTCSVTRRPYARHSCRAARWRDCRNCAPGTLYAPHATSLRMSDLGYRNKSQAGLNVSVNSLEHYIRDLTAAISTPNPDYEKIGVKVDGEYRQLNANVLQIENEYYSFIRPKRVTQTRRAADPRVAARAASSTSRCARWTSACSTRSA